MWRETAQRPKLFGMDAGVMIPLFLPLFDAGWFTVSAAFLGVVALVWLERRGLTVRIGLRRLRARYVGRRHPSVRLYQLRQAAVRRVMR